MPEVVRRLASPSGALEIEILPAIGARLHRLRAFGADLLRTPGDPATHRAEPIFWGAYPMAPWCNRLEPGAFRVGSRTIRVEPTFPDGTAIHGQVFARPWTEVGRAEFRVTAGGDWWPWPYAVTSSFAVTDTSLGVVLRLTNLADEPMPAGLGLHPWLLRPVEVAIRADAVYPSNLEHRAAPEPVSGRFDRSSLGTLPAGLDATWTGLREPPVEVRWPGAGLRGTLSFEAPTRCVAAASADDVDAVAVEPETHAPHGLRRLLAHEPDGLRLLNSGETIELSIVLAIDQAVASTRSRARNV